MSQCNSQAKTEEDTPVVRRLEDRAPDQLKTRRDFEPLGELHLLEKLERIVVTQTGLIS